MSSYNKKCGCDDHKHSKSHAPDICSSMPVSDLFDNSETQDRLIASRLYTSLDGCGRPKTQCQTVAVTQNDLCEIINRKIQDADFCEIIRTQIPFRGLTIGG